MSSFESWGLYPKAKHSIYFHQEWRNESLPKTQKPLLPYGQGRSYGDSCLNDGNGLILTSGMHRFIDFDPATGLLRCEAGLTFAEILETMVPRGWFLPVTPGTKYVSVGGAIANDVHGKNHHVAGSFGHHVTALELLRSDGSRIVCTPDQNPGLFSATIGGLGLTGLITWAEFKMKRITSSLIEQKMTRFKNLDGFFELSEQARNVEYSVSWIDCLAKDRHLGRGIFIQGIHATEGRGNLQPHSKPKIDIPIFAPSGLLNSFTLNAFNTAYYNRPIKKESKVHYDPFFYPLDKIHNWNRLYGRKGFLQYQCVIPPSQSPTAMAKILEEISNARTGSFLAVLKMFGDIPSVGMMSFPRPGATLALDFPNSGPAIFKLLDKLDQIVLDAGGAIYSAKDARMSSEVFLASYPRVSEFKNYVDPQFSSSFWRRVMK